MCDNYHTLTHGFGPARTTVVVSHECRKRTGKGCALVTTVGSWIDKRLGWLYQPHCLGFLTHSLAHLSLAINILPRLHL